ncbi:MAG: hypothetical protein ABEJ30_06950 [Halorientalis sp.]
MRRLLPALLAVLAVTATVAAGVPAAPATGTDTTAAPIVTLQNTTNFLAFPDGAVETRRFGNASLGVTSATAMDAGRFDDRLVVASLERRLERAPNDTARTQAVEAAVADLRANIGALERRQARAIQRYNAGSLSIGAFLHEMAIVDARARSISTTIDGVLTTAARQPGYSLPISLRTDIESLRATPSVYRGPIRQRLGRAVTGDLERVSVYAETSANGVVLARASDSRYVREAFLGSQHDPDGRNQIDITTAYERVRTLYPWADRNRVTVPSARGYGDAAIYRINIDHSHGRLIAFIDGATTEVFREIQEKRLAVLPHETSVVRGANLTLRVNRTHESGPMSVAVSETDGGDPVDARVTVDGQFVGRTGADGRLWTIQPTGSARVNVTAAAGRTVDLTLG